MLENEFKILEILNRYRIEIGVFSNDTERTEEEEKISLGLTNAELMYIHENGSPIRNIPARPVLDMTIKYANDELLNDMFDKIINNVLNNNWKEKDIELELKKLCVRLQNYARDIIYLNDGRLAPNAPSVAKRKKGNHPLFDTGQLARSITCQLIKI